MDIVVGKCLQTYIGNIHAKTGLLQKISMIFVNNKFQIADNQIFISNNGPLL
jgi:hypothetical protein